MLAELRVRNLGVIADLTLVLGPGMTALTGETGAGKTLVVEAIELLLGGRTDPVLVGPDGDEASVEGRFVLPDDRELVLGRVVPRTGRSRAYLDGRLATAGALAEAAGDLVDLYGQHAHQSLLSAAAQRAALDRFASVDTTRLERARAELSRLDAALVALGGDARSRARELDLLAFQIGELDRAALHDPDEDDALAEEEAALADALAHREAAALATEALQGDGAALDAVGAALAALGNRAPFRSLGERLRTVQAELADLASEVRAAGEAIAEDPERLELVRSRRQLLRDLRRKYGDTLAEVMAEHDRLRARAAELTGLEGRVADLEAARARAVAEERAAAAAVGAARRAAAPALAAAVTARLPELAMPKARLEITVGDTDPGDDVVFLLAANPGSPALPLARIASGGELARTMLALRLVLREPAGPDGAPPTLIFDEVDAGVGGEAALAVGRALATLGDHHQVLVVTHLAQVAAFADAQVTVVKHSDDGHTRTRVERVDGEARVTELARMLSGLATSPSAQRHARELLAGAGRRGGLRASPGRSG